MRQLTANGVGSVVALGAHCDDIAIGAGGTLLQLCRSHPGVEVRALVFTGAGGPREAEEHEALNALCPGARLKLVVLDLPDGRLPTRWERCKAEMEALAAGSAPDLVLGPQRGDAHQDHRLLAELVPTVFRDHLGLGYEILKWEGDLGAPTTYVPLPDCVMREKSEQLQRCYPSQHHRDWFTTANLEALARIRGVQCRAPFAEAFYADKLAISFDGAVSSTAETRRA